MDGGRFDLNADVGKTDFLARIDADFLKLKIQN